MTTTPTHEYTNEERTAMFFHRVKKDLGILSTRKMITLVQRVLSQLIQGMPLQQATELLKKLPELFQMLVMKDWKFNVVQQSGYTHLDELVDRIYEEDKKMPHSYFASEVEAMNMVIVILRRLDKYLNLFSFNILNDSCVEELRQIPLEDVA